MPTDLVICTRAVKDKSFNSEPGKTFFLNVPEGEEPTPRHKLEPDPWVRELYKQAVWGTDSRTGAKRGDILVFVHGFNNGQDVVMQRLRRLKLDLTEVGYKGAVVAFDWPSKNLALNYVEDRHDAKATALKLVKDCITLFANKQTPDCCINVHLLGHSTGAYLIREAFDDADDTELKNAAWTVSQLVLISGDISSDSLSAGNATSESLYRHCIRLTNYSNRHDSALKLSNVKRLGMAARVGRVGLPADHPDKASEINCTEYFARLDSDALIKGEDQREVIGSFDHSWHIGNLVFARDLFETLRGDLDRTAIPTREMNADGTLKLVRRANA